MCAIIQSICPSEHNDPWDFEILVEVVLSVLDVTTNATCSFSSELIQSKLNPDAVHLYIVL